MTKEEAIVLLKAQQYNSDTEEAHVSADNILSAFLCALGHKDVVDEYEKIEKWFA